MPLYYLWCIDHEDADHRYESFVDLPSPPTTEEVQLWFMGEGATTLGQETDPLLASIRADIASRTTETDVADEAFELLQERDDDRFGLTRKEVGWDELTPIPTSAFASQVADERQRLATAIDEAVKLASGEFIEVFDSCSFCDGSKKTCYYSGHRMKLIRKVDVGEEI